MKIADALLRRKELQNKVDQLGQIKAQDLFTLKMDRKRVTEGVDDIVAQVPKCDIAQVTEEYDYYANKLRLIDAAIQRTNWTTDIEVKGIVWVDYSEYKSKK